MEWHPIKSFDDELILGAFAIFLEEFPDITHVALINGGDLSVIFEKLSNIFELLNTDLIPLNSAEEAVQ